MGQDGTPVISDEYLSAPIAPPAFERDERDSPRRALAVLYSSISDKGGAGGQLRYRALVHALRRRMPTDILSIEVLLRMRRHAEECRPGEPPPIDLGNPPTAAPFPWVYCARVAADLAAMLGDNRYEIVLMSDAQLYSYAPVIRAAYPGPFVVDLHNAEADQFQEMVNHPDWSLTKNLDGPSADWTKGMALAERMLLATADMVSVPSAFDRRKLIDRHALGTPIEIVSNAVSMAGCPRPEAAQTPEQCAFTAVLNYFPNLLATLEIAYGIGPAIMSVVPGLKVVVAGSNPPAFVSEALRENGVELVANPADIRPFFQRAIQIVPLTLGGGTRLKILEAFAAGASVVSTPKGIEGIEAEAGTHYLVASTAAEFAEAVAKVVRHPEEDLRRRQRAWDLTASRYSWAAIEEPVGQMLDTVTAAGVRRPI